MGMILNQLIRAYSYVPPPLRSVAATLYGHYVRRWRYSAATERMVNEAIAREKWSDEEWSTWRRAQLEASLTHAATHVPFYRRYWQERGVRSIPLDLKEWPLLKKESVRTSAKELISDLCSPRRLFREASSGSSGSPIQVYFDRDTLVGWYALMEARWRRWYGISRDDRWALTGCKEIIPPNATKPPFWLWNGGLNALYLSVWHVHAANLPHYLDAIARHRVTYLWAFPSVLTQLAQAALDRGQTLRLKVVITTSEPLLDFQRALIREAFQAPVIATFGQTEKLFAMSECEHGQWHAWPETGEFELLDDNDLPVPRGTPGRLVCTSFLNRAMPLIRYDIGDIVKLPAIETRCACGRNLPRVERVVGRTVDAVITRDGKRFDRFDEIFQPPLPVREAQVVQTTLDCIQLKIVRAPEWTEAHERKVVAIARTLLGEMKIEVIYVNELERTAGGKVPAVISHVSRGRAKATQESPAS